MGYKNIRQLHEILLIHRLLAYVFVLKYFIQTKDSLNNITAYTYDQTGSLITLTDAKTNATTFTYDLLGRLTKQTDPMAKQTTYTYDTQGNLTSKTDPLTNTIQYTYDALNRLIQKTYPDASASGGTTTYQYDAIGNLTSATNQYISYTFAYDALGRMTSVSDNLGKSISYVYDANSNRTSMTSPIGTTSYVYNALNQLTQLVQGTNPPQADKLFTFVYDSLGRRTSLSMPNGTTTSYSYDSLSRLTNLSTLNSQLQSINSNIYTYDSVGNKLSKQDSAGTHNFTYDNTYQLTQATHPPQAGQPNEAFAYDAVGNRTNTTVDAANKLLQDPNASYQYDANGNRYVKTQSDGTIIYYSYDYEGRLTRVETQKPGLTSVAVYKYDALGRRIEKAVTENSVTTTTRYLYDNEDIIAEYDGNGNLITKYIHGLGIDEPLAMEKNSSTYYYHADGLGSVVALSDSTGIVVQTYAYDSFGNITNQTGTINQPYTFTGREYDSESGLYYLRARELDSKTGTFTQKDPIGFAGGDVNLFRYVFNSPVNYTDPFGLDIWLEGPSPEEPQGHLSINVGNPNGSYKSYSFGLGDEGFLQGEVYEDQNQGGAYVSGYYLMTTTKQDKAALDYLNGLIGMKAPYRPWRTCRSFSKDEFNKLKKAGYGKLKIGIPPLRSVNPKNPSLRVPFPSSTTVTDSNAWR